MAGIETQGKVLGGERVLKTEIVYIRWIHPSNKCSGNDGIEQTTTITVETLADGSENSKL